jgi:3-dehydrosphinganine reductase
MKSFQGITAFITGGSSGIGLELSKQLASQGAHVLILSRDPEKLETACQEVTNARKNPDQRVEIAQVDVTNQEQVFQVMDQVRTVGLFPDLLINSAGYSRPGLFTDIDIEYFHRMIDVHYFGTLNMVKAVIPGMIERKAGHIVNISSIAGFHGVYGYAAYAPAKFAVRGLSDVLRYELKPYNIRLSIVFPPDTRTPGYEVEKQYYPPLLKALSVYNTLQEPAKVAERILKGVRKNNYLILPGFDSSLLYNLNRLPGHLPYRILDLMMFESQRRVPKNNNGH